MSLLFVVILVFPLYVYSWRRTLRWMNEDSEHPGATELKTIWDLTLAIVCCTIGALPVAVLMPIFKTAEYIQHQANKVNQRKIQKFVRTVAGESPVQKTARLELMARASDEKAIAAGLLSAEEVDGIVDLTPDTWQSYD